MGAPGLAIREDVATPTELRRLAKKEPRRRTAQRMLAIANALEGMVRSTAEAARAAGIERQSLRDAVVRFNAEGLAGLIDRPYGRRPERLSEGEQAALVAYILRGPDPEKGEPSSWTLADLCRVIEDRFNKRMCPQSMSRVVRRLGLSRQKARPVHPERNAKAAEAFAKGGSAVPSRLWPKLIPTNASPSGSKMKRALGRRAGPRTAGG
jgi:transposase